jgi:hypothetical protein
MADFKMNYDVVKPRKSWCFTIGRVLFSFNWAKTWTWVETNKDKKQRTTALIALDFVQREVDDENIAKMIKIIIVPLIIQIGWV